MIEPHHDGSGLYVTNQYPVLGEQVGVRVRIPGLLAVQEVLLRLTIDGESQYRRAEKVVDGDAGHEQWWQATLPMANPSMHYRFVVVTDDGECLSLNGEGVTPRDVSDRADFCLTTASAPGDWTDDAVVYQVFPDRFARSARADEHELPDWAEQAAWDDPIDRRPHHQGHQFYGGDLWGVVEHLDQVQAAGANTIYLTPFFPSRSNHRYDASTFAHVDPLLGGDEALAALTAAAHERGMRVIGDITTNHTGVGHEWFRTAREVPTSAERDFYLWQPDGGYVSWLGVSSLPKLDYHCSELRRRMYEGPDSVVRHWMAEPYNLDGWRIDVANMTGRHATTDLYGEVARGVRASMDDTGREHMLVAEHFHDHTLDVPGDGWQGVMDYAGFARPAWEWLRVAGKTAGFFWDVVPLPRLGGEMVRDIMKEFSAMVPWTVRTHSFNLLGSHDTTRIRTLVGNDPDRVHAALGLVFGMPGIPMVTYGDEIGMEGEYGEDGRRAMPWQDEASWERETQERMASLARLRTTDEALRTGGMRWVFASDDVLAWVRETAGRSVLVVSHREAAHAELPVLRGAEHGAALHGDVLAVDGDHLVLDAPCAGTVVWGWDNDLPGW